MDIKKQVGGILEKVGKTYITYSKMHQDLVLSDLTDYISQILSLIEQPKIQAGEDGLAENPYDITENGYESVRFSAFKEGCEDQKALDDKVADERINILLNDSINVSRQIQADLTAIHKQEKAEAVKKVFDWVLGNICMNNKDYTSLKAFKKQTLEEL